MLLRLPILSLKKSRLSGPPVQDCNLLVLLSVQCLLERSADFAHWGARRGMRNDDVLVLHFFEQGCEFIDVHVFSGLGPARVLSLVEGALGYQDFALGDVIEL